MSCPCDVRVHPHPPEFAAGLSRIPKQQEGFPEYLDALLHGVGRQRALDPWRARDLSRDGGRMLLEMWAYVLDVLAFYDDQITNASFLRTAHARASLRAITELLGYRLRPATAASVLLALVADGPRPVTVPAGTAFRSDAFGDEPPQVFETGPAIAAHLLRNAWTVGPVARHQITATPGGGLYFDPREVALAPRMVAILSRTDDDGWLRAARVTRVRPSAALDGQRYVEVGLDPFARAAGDAAGLDVGTVRVESLALRAQPWVVDASDASAEASVDVGPPTTIVLDSLYRQIRDGQRVVVEHGAALTPARVGQVTETTRPVTELANAPVTRVELDVAGPAAWADEPNRLVLHFHPVHGGWPTSPAKVRVQGSDFLDGAALEGLLDRPPKGSGRFLLKDAEEQGAFARGSVTVSDDGIGRAKFEPDPAIPELRVPVEVYGNVVRATRGETVRDEELGFGDGAVAFQTFELKKTPLTYVADASAPGGGRSTLQVRVGGALSREVPSFFGVGPGERVHVVRQDEEGRFRVTFGDGRTGARLASGEPVVATYRFGAGAVKPPAGAIHQPASPVEGLRRVKSPVAASGGSDADSPDDIRANGPASALLLGRTISIPDFEAAARDFGVLTAAASWAWDGIAQTAAVVVHFVPDGGEGSGIESELQAYLAGMSEPGTIIRVREADALDTALTIELEPDSRYDGDAVSRATLARLLDPRSGILAPRNARIGRPFFRSEILAEAQAVAGVRSVRRLDVDGAPAPWVIDVQDGQYRRFDALDANGWQPLAEKACA